MLKDITLGQYYPGDSVFHKSDPRAKILITLVLMALIFIKAVFISYALIFALILTAIVISGIRISYLLKAVKPILFILIIMFLANILTIKTGNEVIKFWIFKITDDGLFTGIRMFTRLILVVITASFMTYTTTPIVLTDGIEKLLNPLKKMKFPVHEMAMMMTIALRFIPTLMEETDKIIKAQSSRGADFDSGGLLKRAKSFIPVLIPLFISAFRRADELAVAMESRCYRGDINRTKMNELRFTASDLKLSAGFLAFLTLWILL
jgi:energy-coupling factor transport system permease protein